MCHPLACVCPQTQRSVSWEILSQRTGSFKGYLLFKNNFFKNKDAKNPEIIKNLDLGRKLILKKMRKKSS
jgi:hypothetical protein